MGKGIRYSDEFKQEAVNQVVIHGYLVADVADRLGISTRACTTGRDSFLNQPDKGWKIRLNQNINAVFLLTVRSVKFERIRETFGKFDKCCLCILS